MYLAVHKYKKYDISQFTRVVQKRRRLADYEKSTGNTVEEMGGENVRNIEVGCVRTIQLLSATAGSTYDLSQSFKRTIQLL